MSRHHVRLHLPCAARTVLLLCAALLASTPSAAQDSPPPLDVNIAARSGFFHTERSGESTDEFVLDSVRLFVTGPVTSDIRLTFNTEYDGRSNQVRVMDAIAQFEWSPAFNVWVGRFLPPSDRANLYGPYYGSHWSIYTDGIQDGYPFIIAGRANGAAYWGQFGKVGVSGGLFDGGTITASTTPIKAGRINVNFWDAEPGYYPSGTYYGGRNILSVGAAGQVQAADQTAFNVDLLVERKVGAGGAVSLEGEFARYDRLGGYDPRYATSQGGYVLGSYLLPVLTGQGRFQILGKVSRAAFSGGLGAADLEYDQTTTEFNVNYILKGYDARIMVFYLDTRFSAVRPDSKRAGVGVQLQR